MSTYTHNAVNARSGHGAAPVPVTGPLAKGTTGTATLLTCTALPDIEDTVQLWDGPLCIAAITFRKSRDAALVNIAQTVAKAYREDRGLQIKVLSDGGLTGAYSLSYS